ncbi:MAG: S1C family serine protease [Candidatus Flexifilum sp.]|jgi:2-alkenal reductase
MRIRTSLAALIAVALLVVGAFYLGTAVTSSSAAANHAPLTALNPAQQAQPVYTTESEQVFNQVYERVSPSVVSITVLRQARMSSAFGGVAVGRGTGFVYDTDGHIVTNYHVIDGAVRIEVNFVDGTIALADLVGGDPDSDLAIIRVNDVPSERLVPVTFANSGNLFVGQEVVAIGSPFNQRWTMTTGIISGLGRSILGVNNYRIGSVIQTDAAINPGNSGGPLLNLQGQVIGVNSQIISTGQQNSGIGFAIPSNLVQRVARELIDHGDVQYGFLGIGGEDVNLYYIQALDLPNNTRGAVVTNVEPGLAAARAGVRAPEGGVEIDGVLVPTQLDIIIAVDGNRITGMADLVGYLAENTAPGQTVTLTILRNGRETIDLPVTLDARP